MNPVNLFFACDNAYVPFLAVTLTSLKENCNPKRDYALRILHTGLDPENIRRLTDSFASDGFTMEFIDITQAVEQFADKLHTRDYYSKSTYYRLFIPDLFPGLDKALYLDSDVVLLSDVSELYDVDLEENLVGAIPDSVVGSIPALALYTKKRLRVAADHYFNAGVLLMNLDAMRKCDFLNVFLRLLQSVTFQIAQDQDYLNVICKNRVEYVGFEWNTMPCDVHTNAPKLIHYNLDFKPWHRDDVAFGDVFWDYAERSGYLEEIRKVREGYTEWHVARSAEETTHLIAMGKKQARKRTANMLIRWKIRRVVNV